MALTTGHVGLMKDDRPAPGVALFQRSAHQAFPTFRHQLLFQ